MNKDELFKKLDNASKEGADFLDLSNNGIDVLPSEIGNVKRLISLVLRNNNLGELPSEMGQLINLAVLDISNNPLQSLPKEISNLPLRRLDAQSCKLTALPFEIRNMRFEILDLRNNPLPIPIEILERTDDPHTILEYYFRHTSQERLPLNEAKMILVGQGSVGKTSVANMLINGVYDKQERKTEGISIQKWNVAATSALKKDTDKARGVRVNVWDFGGQEIMHATHQFFLTKRSLYLLVVDARLSQEENRIEYWLKIIQSLGGESPIILVGNKVDQHPLDIDRRGLSRKYSNLKATIETSCETNTGIDRLRSIIAEVILSLPHVEDQLPTTWFRVKSQLEKMQEDFIRYDEYLRICSRNSIRDELSQETLLGFLHDLGIVLNFRDDPHLQETNVLNPEWVTNGVYRILNSYSLFQNRGVLQYRDLDEILDIDRYPKSKRAFIIDMMEKFELCFSLGEKRIGFLVPDLLPKDELYTGGWNKALAFQYQYDVLPSSIITRFIVRMHPYIYKNTLWRSGVILHTGKNRALIKADYEERRIFVWVSGQEKTRRDFLSAIRFQFDSIHKTLAKIVIKEKIPLPESAITVDYEHLVKLEHKGVKRFIPEGLDHEINVKHLLDKVVTKQERDEIVRDKIPAGFSTRLIIAYIVILLLNISVAAVSAFRVVGTWALIISILVFIYLIVSFLALIVSIPRFWRTMKISIISPKYIGRFIFDIFGKGDKSADFSNLLMGYLTIFVVILLIWRIIDLNFLITFWRFFFPESK
jgi:internalin A